MIRTLAAVALGVIVGTIYTAERLRSAQGGSLVRGESEPAPFARAGGVPLLACSECGGWHPADAPALHVVR